MSLVQDLRGCDCLGALTQQELLDSAPIWQARSYERGDTVWTYSDGADELAVLVSGTLEVFLGATLVGEVKPGSVVGALATFTRGWRTASVLAREAVGVRIVDRAGLETARAKFPAVYDALLSEAMVACARRVRAVDREIARLASGSRNAPERKEKGTFQRLVAKLSGSTAGSAPTPESVLDLLPVVSDAPKAVIAEVARTLEPRFVDKGEPLFLEAEQSDSLYLLAVGKIDVVRNVRGRRGEVLAELYPGAVFGTGALLTRERRGASCVAGAETPVWVYEMTRERFEALQGQTGRIWREALLHALWFELSSADERLAELRREVGEEA